MTDALVRVQEASYRRADAVIRSSWPPDKAMDAAELASFLDECRYCVLATSTGRGRPQARPVSFVLLDGVFWFGTGVGGRLRNLERTPWVSVVFTDGHGEEHRAVVVDGFVMIAAEPPAGLLDLWERRYGTPPVWAAAWIELRPERLFSHRNA